MTAEIYIRICTRLIKPEPSCVKGLGSVYRSFETLPLEYQVDALNWLGDYIRRIQIAAPVTAEALQPLYDNFYMRIGQQQADFAMTPLVHTEAKTS